MNSNKNNSNDYETRNENESIRIDFSKSKFWSTNREMITLTESELMKIRPEDQRVQYGCIQLVPNSTQKTGSSDEYNNNPNSIENSYNVVTGVYLVTNQVSQQSSRNNKKRKATTALRGGATNKRRTGRNSSIKHYQNSEDNSDENSEEPSDENSDENANEAEPINENSNSNDKDSKATKTTKENIFATNYNVKNGTTDRIYFEHHVSPDKEISLGPQVYIRLTGDSKGWLYITSFGKKAKLYIYDKVETITGGQMQHDVEVVGGKKSANIPFKKPWTSKDDGKNIASGKWYGTLPQTIVNLESEFDNSSKHNNVSEYMDYILMESLRSNKYYNSNAIIVFKKTVARENCNNKCKLRYSQFHCALDIALIINRCIRSNFLSINERLNKSHNKKYVYNFMFPDPSIATRGGLELKKKRKATSNKAKTQDAVEIAQHFGFQKLS